MLDSPDDGRKVSLFRHDFAPGPVTEAFLEFARGLDPLLHRIVVQFDRSSVYPFPERVANLARLPEHVQRLVRAGSHVVSVEERWTLNQFNMNRHWPSPEQEALTRKAFARECRRVFGTADFDVATQLELRDGFGSQLLGAPDRGIGHRVLGLALPADDSTCLSAGEIRSAYPFIDWFDEVVESADELHPALPTG
ncbi:hypothetical protein [Paeniglutamicibacter cryotolerans]|uniref:Uncharacterized protein n=1 Tax=Paeniglutamicibacter cryotolerans TaxID=670079 RepID=A0A839QME4_9MICC|nr:hypothetical protein [Paeniglutamicibacter cryotolerans]MBB2997419.1 hypothetical protein [Paeniglutamicibacter cryotolerans]